MSTRLQVVMDEDELERYRACARAEGVNLSTWVRTALALAERSRPRRTAEEKLAAIEAAVRIPAEQRIPMPPIERYHEYRDWHERTRYGDLPEP